MWGETSTGEFSQLVVGDVFKRPWVHQWYCKISDALAIGLTTGAEYRFLPHHEVRQDCYTNGGAERIVSLIGSDIVDTENQYPGRNE